MSKPIKVLVPEGTAYRFAWKVEAMAEGRPFEIIAPQDSAESVMVAAAAGVDAILSYKAPLTRAVIEAMQTDEAGHAQSARDLGARELPPPVKSAMRCAAKVMTTLAYRI